MYLVTAMRKKIELEPSGLPVEIQLPDHVCGVMFVYDDATEAQRVADMTPGAHVEPLLPMVEEKKREEEIKTD
jgi:hypothetical protein